MRRQSVALCEASAIELKRDWHYNYIATMLSLSGDFQEDRLCGLLIRVPGYVTEMYCVYCEVRTEFIYVM
jgi:hypothetical protein